MSGWERCKALESILNNLNIEYRSETLRKSETKKSKNDTLFYLFDELETSDCEIEQSKTDTSDTDETCYASTPQKQPSIYLHEKKSTDRKVSLLKN